VTAQQATATPVAPWDESESQLSSPLARIILPDDLDYHGALDAD